MNDEATVIPFSSSADEVSAFAAGYRAWADWSFASAIPAGSVQPFLLGWHAAAQVDQCMREKLDAA